MAEKGCEQEKCFRVLLVGVVLLSAIDYATECSRSAPSMKVQTSIRHLLHPVLRIRSNSLHWLHFMLQQVEKDCSRSMSMKDKEIS